jgi:phosphatidate cytidylyltransferase
MAFSIFAALGISASFPPLVLIRDSHRNILGLLYILLALGSGWFADTGAYFTGMALGRHKLAPLISPKKTVEGAVGGIIINMICCSLTAYIFTLTAEKLNYMHLHVNYPLLIIISAAAAAAGILGDLSASIIKRQCKIKDFGNIMPGHGGVMDRFDSVLLTAPLIYLVSSAFNIVEII